MKSVFGAFFVSALCLSFVSTSFAADHGSTLHGTITDPLGAVVRNARVTLIQSGKALATTASDGNGVYAFTSVPVGRYVVRAEAAGFAAKQSDLIFVSGSAVLDLALKVGTVSQEIVVSATGTPVPESQVGASVTVLTRDQFQDQLDIFNPLEQVPGVQVVQSGQHGAATSLFIRGGNSNANKILLDGVALNDIGGVVDFGTLASTGIEQVEVLRGPNSVLYGPDAMAGVVSLTTRRGSTLTPELSYSFDGGSFGSRRHDGSLSGVLKRVDYLGEISRFDTNNSLPNSSFHNGSYVANFGLAINSKTELRFTGRYTTTALGQPNALDLFGIPDDSFQRDQDAYISVAFQNQTTEKWHNLLRYAATRLRLQDDNPSPSGIPFDNGFGQGLNFLGNPVTIKGANGFSVSGQGVLDFAGTFPELTSSSTKRDTVYFQSDYAFDKHLTGLLAFRFEQERGFTLAFGSKTPDDRNNFSYIGEIHGSFGRLYATAGGSVERNTIFGTAAVPRASLAYYLVRPRSDGWWNGTKLKANYGQGIKEPSIFESNSSLFDLLAQGGQTQLISQFGVAPIAAERSRSYDLGFEQLAAQGKLKFSGTFFHNQFTNQIEFVPNTALPSLGVPASVASQAAFGATINSGDERALGAELEIEAHVGHGLTARASYTYLDAVIQRSFTNDAFFCSPPNPQSFCGNPAFPGVAIGAFAPLVGERPFRRAPHTGNFTLDYARKKLDLSVNGYLVSRRDDSTFLSDGFFGNSLLLPNRNLAAGFQKIDFGGSYRVNSHLKFFTVMENLVSQHYDPVFGFPAQPFSIRAGFKITLGGESWK